MGRDLCGLNHPMVPKEGARRFSYHFAHMWGTRGRGRGEA